MNALETLQHYFHYNEFQSGQAAVIDDLNKSQDVLLTLPTGAGKSICYQVPALMNNGLTLVVTPLLSLMEDQVRHLKAFGIKQVAALNSFNTKKERQHVLKHLSQLKILYVSPELLQQDWILKRLKKLYIRFFVVDEAHCISQWGHEFRPDYMKLASVLHSLRHPTLLLVTATLTEDVKRDIFEHFSERNILEHLHMIDRDNISFIVEKCVSNMEKDRYIVDCLSAYHVPTIIYFSSKKETERVSHHLRTALPDHRVAYYHGDLENNERMLIQQQFLSGELDVICATSAFGMGVNKRDVRLVIHYHLPTQIESFVQEVGRAGRDQLHSVSISLVTEHDRLITERLIEGEMIEEAVLVQLFRLLDQYPEIDMDEFVDRHQLNEVHRRYLQNYLENHDIINDNKTINHHNVTEFFKVEWIETITKRQQFKRKKLLELLLALNGDRCIRRSIYQPFQTKIKDAPFGCCSVCGFTLAQFNPIQLQTSTEKLSWEEKLLKRLRPHSEALDWKGERDD
ncbi:ATP-dependent DNA helicase RecQ [Halolactibacillus halophilus]|uniref:ATP-dependent DNA helicase RecQ n=1 Tax=Halolactibacillus halophilus TaxID=306540 RepID=A0A1I5P807_9BACI|nr:RecQ family ATP-dependent DNA helicase [Halolactibacillus halophilus]GEM01671.1 ATP-dependent DNA helicase RecQ [Halolactibacillus halophilus]SFP30249.1 ATP-dependent DNA helicase RecQ [Halolactibacillus halophilus]